MPLILLNRPYDGRIREADRIYGNGLTTQYVYHYSFVAALIPSHATFVSKSISSVLITYGGMK